MIPETYYITDIGKGGLGIMPRPRGNDWLEDEIQSLKYLGYSVVVSFLTKVEELELELEEENNFCKKNDVEFISFPIIDRGVPAEQEFLALVSDLYNKIIKGEKIILHCRGGIGRAGITASSILIKHGLISNDAFERVSKARKINVPDTEEQKNWVQNIEQLLRTEPNDSADAAR